MTSKSGQKFQNLCLVCNKKFQGYTKGQSHCSTECYDKSIIMYKKNLQFEKLRQELLLYQLNKELMPHPTDKEVMDYKEHKMNVILGI